MGSPRGLPIHQDGKGLFLHHYYMNPNLAGFVDAHPLIHSYVPRSLRWLKSFFSPKFGDAHTNIYRDSYGGFLKWGYPEIIHVNRVFHVLTIHFGDPAF